MKTSFYSLIVISPENPNVLKLRITRTAVAILIAGALVSFGLVAAAGFIFPSSVDDHAQHQLRVENERLKIANQNARIQATKLNDELKALEEQSGRIEELMASD